MDFVHLSSVYDVAVRAHGGKTPEVSPPDDLERWVLHVGTGSPGVHVSEESKNVLVMDEWNIWTSGRKNVRQFYHMPLVFCAAHAIEQLWNICVMTSACCSWTQGTWSVCAFIQLFFKPYCCCLLGGSHMPHTQWILWAVFKQKTPGPRHWVRYCLTEQQVQLRPRAHVHLLSVGGWGYILSMYFQNGSVLIWQNKE